MLTPILAGAILFFVSLCAFLAFDNMMMKQENTLLEAYNQFLLRRAKNAEWESAQALDARVQAEQDALSANAEAVEARDKVARLSSHVAGLMREQSQLQSLQLPTTRVFAIEKSPAQNQAIRSAHIN